MSPTRTLCVDVGGSAIKAAVLDDRGERVSDRVSRPTPYPLGPDELASVVAEIAAELGGGDRVSLGFPGMVRAGQVLTAPFFVTTSGPGSDGSIELTRAWADVDLQGLLQRRLGCPVLVANDADVHGAGVVVGRGLELVITLGTGFGTGLFLNGVVCPHLELAHHPFRDGETYNQHLGDAARRLVGPVEWNRRVRDALDVLASLLHHDHVWIGGGNARHLTGELPPAATVITQDAGLVGGVHLWRTADPIG